MARIVEGDELIGATVMGSYGWSLDGMNEDQWTYGDSNCRAHRTGTAGRVELVVLCTEIASARRLDRRTEASSDASSNVGCRRCVLARDETLPMARSRCERTVTVTSRHRILRRIAMCGRRSVLVMRDVAGSDGACSAAGLIRRGWGAAWMVEA